MNQQNFDDPPPQDNDPNAPQPEGEGGQFTQRIRHQQLSALVPEAEARGTFANSALVLNGPHEFVIDFIQSVARPQQVAARIILAPSILPNVVRALKQNIQNYTNRFGAPMELPKPPQDRKPPGIEDIYEQLKVPETVASGSYANTVMITHSPTEFCFDFITGFYPRSAVAKRIYMAVPQVPRVLQTLERSWNQYQQKVQQQRRKRMEQQGGGEGTGGEWAGPEDVGPPDDPPTAEGGRDIEPPRDPQGPGDN